MIKIFLDDIRVPQDDSWVIVKSYLEFVDFIITHKWNLISEISLDHDLGLEGENEKTGYDVAKWLVNYSLDRNVLLPLIRVHSANPVGAKNIMSLINGYLISNDLNPTCISHVVQLKRNIKLNFD
jgi:hypothetical protein